MLNVGRPVTKQTVDSTFGGLATGIADLMARADQANTWLGAATDLDLEGLGYTIDDITALRDAAYAYGVLAQLYSGDANLPTATDFRVAIRKLAGLG